MTAASGPERRRHLRPSVPDDDLLAGFGREGRPQWLRVFFASTIGASLVVWEVAFDLGAYHTVFYSRLFQILVVSTVLLAGSLILRHQVRVRLWMRFVLAVPLLWLLERSVAPLGHTSTAAKVLDDVMVGLVVASLPFTIWALVRILAPDFFDLHSRRLQVISVVRGADRRRRVPGRAVQLPVHHLPRLHRGRRQHAVQLSQSAVRRASVTPAALMHAVDQPRIRRFCSANSASVSTP